MYNQIIVIQKQFRNIIGLKIGFKISSNIYNYKLKTIINKHMFYYI